ncbi:hypothetical protein NMY22_g781 [Coprinellus aureogranulatus]|nr:hypothetical protein NMY22_g781 [Coprinellus aureogranulatus]
MRAGIYDIAVEEDWFKSEWFKLRIRPKSGASDHVTANLPPLPLGKTVVQVLADYLGYLQKCAEAYIKHTHADGRDIWASVESDIDYVISHPNGWEGYQQSQIRDAVVLAGLIPDTNAGHSRVSLVTEGEASLHFSIHNGLPRGAIRGGEGVVIIDAGGGTIDISAYSKAGTATKFEEVAASRCHFHGSIYVSIHARIFLEKCLKESDFYDDLDHIISCFDKSTKICFNNDQEPQYIKFGGMRDNDAACNIRFGQLKIAGSDVAAFFTPSVKCIVDSVLDMIKNGHESIKHIVLVGGFSANDWLLANVEEALAPKGLNVIRPENHANKAVSDGAISFYLDHFVTTRVSKVAYGYFGSVPYDGTDPDHRQREGTTYTSKTLINEKKVPGRFRVILPKNTQVPEEKEFRRKTRRVVYSKDELKDVEIGLWCYKGNLEEPQWEDVDSENYVRLCNIMADPSHLHVTPRPQVNGFTGEYWAVNFTVVLCFSAVELRAHLTWMEEGVEKRGPATIIYEPNDV